MAVNNSNDPNNQQNAQQEQVQGAQPQQAGQPMPGQSMPMQQYNARKQQQRGTGFTNIGRILGANQGAGQRMGQQIGQNIGEQAKSVREGIEAGRNQFQAGKTQAFNQAQGAVNVGNQLAKQAGESDQDYAARVANQQGDIAAQGQALQNATYTGPQGLQGASKLQSQAATVSALGRLAGSQAGQEQLLRNIVAGRGAYTRGQSGLDRLLLGQGGQGAIQQGRVGLGGLEQRAQSEIGSAEQQAQLAKEAVDRNRVNALKAVQESLSGESGIQAQAQKQAQEFTQKAGRLKQILSGVDENGNAITQLSPEDQQLLDNAQAYGLDTSAMMYSKDPNAVQNAIQNLVGGFAQDFGNARYLGPQQQAAANLAKFLGQKDIQSQIEANKFNEDAFRRSEKDAFTQLEGQKKFDTETADILKRFGGMAKSAEEKIAAQQQARADMQKQIDAALAEINNPKYQLMPGATNQANYLFDPTNPNVGFSGGAAAGSGNMGQLYYQDPEYKNAVDKYLLNKFQLDQMASPGQMSYNDKTMGDLQSLVNEANKYGFLAFADQGEDAIWDPRFKGLGLAPTSSRSGDIRSSEQFFNAANKALGPEQSLKEYVLKKYLQNQGTGNV